MSAEEMAEQCVTLAAGRPGGGHRVRLAIPGEAPVLLGLHQNPAVARDEATAVRRFTAAVIRAGRADPGAGEVSPRATVDDPAWVSRRPGAVLVVRDPATGHPVAIQSTETGGGVDGAGQTVTVD